MDQTPLQFEFLDSKCYDMKGVKTVWVKSHGFGWDKRQATLMVHVTADGVFFFFFYFSFLYAAKGYDNYKQIITGLAGHIAM